MNITHTGKLLDYKNYLPFSTTFIETGTAAGDGVQRALDAGFNPVISMEAAKVWFEKSTARFAAAGAKVFIYEGKSTDVLGGVLHFHLYPNKVGIIYLDAHPAGPTTAGHEEWLSNPSGQANQHNIIMAELEIITKYRVEHIVIIDDVNGMADGCAQQYMDVLLAANPNYKFEFWDENLSGTQLYKDKILVCLP